MVPIPTRTITITYVEMWIRDWDANHSVKRSEVGGTREAVFRDSLVFREDSYCILKILRRHLRDPRKALPDATQRRINISSEK